MATHPTQADPPSSPFYLGTDYLMLPRAPDTWAVEGLLPASGSMLLFGDPKVGKSYAALQLACCLVSGSEWLGFRTTPQPVAYVQLDTPRGVWALRVGKLALSGHCVERVHFADRQTLGTFPFDILDPKHFRLLAGAVEAIKPGVVVMDTLRESHSADENDSTEMQEAIAALEAAIQPAAMILVAHARKSNPQFGYDLMNDNRGSNYVVGRMDAIIRFSPKSLRVSSRTLEEHSIKTERQDDGTWERIVDEVDRAIEILVATNPQTPIRELARQLHVIFPKKTEDACRGMLRRKLQASL